MKPFSIFLAVSARMLLLSPGLCICACRENPRQAVAVDSEAKPTVTQQEEPPDERINELQREIEAGRQNIENIEAFAEMERAKLEENPEYDPSFLQEALHEQQEIRKAVESGEKRLKELTPAKE
jgi:vacuolar-type H+-ATPase subunit I/STV1